MLYSHPNRKKEQLTEQLKISMIFMSVLYAGVVTVWTLV